MLLIWWYIHPSHQLRKSSISNLNLPIYRASQLREFIVPKESSTNFPHSHHRRVSGNARSVPSAKGHEHVLIRPLTLHQAVRVELLKVPTPDMLVVANAIVDRRHDRASWDVLASHWLATSQDDSRQRQLEDRCQTE